MTRSTFTHTHASGYAQADAGKAVADISRYRITSDLITTTEHKDRRFDAAFLAEGWDSHLGHECRVAWRTDVFELAGRPRVRARHGFTFKKGTNPQAVARIEYVPLRHLDTGKRIRVRVAHMPSSVQYGDGFRGRTPRVAAWVATLALWGRLARRDARKRPRQAQINVADWNVNLHRRHWRVLIGRALGQRCPSPLPREGSHHKRLIDGFFFLGLSARGSRVLAKGASSDHRAVQTYFHIA